MALHSGFDLSWIDHGMLYRMASGIYTNGAEEFFSRTRRAEIGHHHYMRANTRSAMPGTRMA